MSKTFFMKSDNELIEQYYQIYYDQACWQLGKKYLSDSEFQEYLFQEGLL